MIALEDDLIGQFVKINVVEIVPRAQERNQILFADFFRNPIPHKQLVGETAFNRRGVENFQPLQLFGKRARLVHVERSPHKLLKILLQDGGISLRRKIFNLPLMIELPNSLCVAASVKIIPPIRL